ncbi:DNA cross-link repair protein pso2/snm1 [Ceratocystis platani]|uniref:DNA cross-link repair protein pso2/snm1 n=1 Tax=Ceratocystis fimbriata f. sp. platani TaxID=88771 RepID=A0A0F8D462_CERFI|nr:DNA cross-link repair protein pso2/snm1 [Ceratocystis platani]
MAKFDFGKRKKPAQTKIAFPKLTPEEVEAANEKKKAKPTTTILSFFKKVDQDVLFISEDAKALSALNRAGGNLEEKSPDEADIRYNESNSPVKRRKLSSEPELPETIRPEMPPLLKHLAENQDQQPSIPSSPSKGASKVGGFVFDDSDSETEPLDENRGESAAFQFKSRASSPSPMKPFMPHETSVLEELLRKAPASPPPVSTSANPEVNEDLSNDHEDDDELFLGANVIDIAEEEREAMLAIRELDRREAALNGIVIHDDEGDFHAPDQEDKPMYPRYAFPPQDDVISACAELCSEISANPDLPCELWDRLQKGTKPKKPSPAAISKFFSNNTPQAQTQTTLPNAPDKKLLVICGTYSIGKERVCVGIAKAMKTKIFAPSRKLAICKLLDDPTLTALLTSDPLAAQVHLQSLGEIRADVIEEYRRNYGTRFSRVIAFRPSGWTYHPPAVCSDGSRAPPPNSQPGQVPTTQLLHGAYWRARFNKSDVTAVRGATKTAMCLGVPYSEHSSFRELALFVMSLNIERVVPTVNVGSDAARKKMKGWIDRWISERRRGGLLTVLEGDEDSGQTVDLWDGKIGKSGGVWW